MWEKDPVGSCEDCSCKNRIYVSDSLNDAIREVYDGPGNGRTRISYKPILAIGVTISWMYSSVFLGTTVFTVGGTIDGEPRKQ